jgi:Secretion system C-terminal sorting domain
MKKSFILLFFSVMLSHFVLQGQNAVLTETGCSSVHVALTGACSNAFDGSGYQGNYGNWYFYSFQTYKYRVTLTKITGGSSQPIQVSTISSSSADWTNLEQGATYKIVVEPFLCTSQQAYNGYNNQFLGYKGIWGSAFSSNTVIIGAPTIADNSWFFSHIPLPGSTTNNTNLEYYTATEIVKMDGSTCKNYERYAIAIQEFYPDGATQGRWRPVNNNGSGGWTTGQIGLISLTDAWAKDYGWTFLTHYKYRVQVVIQKSSCVSWTQVLKDFVICSNPYYDCRTGGEKLDKITISPNPTSNKFQLNGLDFSTDKNYKVSISDLSGKEIQTIDHVNSNEFNTDNFANGIYIVNVMADNRRLFSSKLIVNK